MATTQEETELKFEVPRRWDCPPLAGCGGVTQMTDPDVFEQVATYFDTPDLALLRARRTLRRRLGGTDAGWHLKLPGDADTRTEVHEPVGDSPVRIPASLRALVADVIGPAPLIPVAELTTTRALRELQDGDAALVAELVDDAVETRVLLDDERIVRWREVELELGPAGTPEALAALSEALQDSGLRPSSSRSKLGRALAAPLARRESREGGAVAAGEVIAAYLAQQLGVLQAWEPAVREDAPDAVHKTRVATRRARSALKTFRPLFDPSVADDLRSELGWLAGLLGGPRDAEVLLARLEKALDAVEPELLVGPVRERILGMLQADHDAGRAALLEALDGDRYEQLLRDLAEVVQRPPYLGELAHDETGGVVAEHAGRAARSVTKVARRARAADPEERDEIIHDIRKRAKAARYADEAAAVVRGHKGAAQQWTALQEALGDYQDGVVAVEALQRACAQAREAGEDTFTYGVLVEREAAAAREIRSRYGELLTAALKRGKGVHR